jgi:hypothetical protein
MDDRADDTEVSLQSRRENRLSLISSGGDPRLEMHEAIVAIHGCNTQTVQHMPEALEIQKQALDGVVACLHLCPHIHLVQSALPVPFEGNSTHRSQNLLLIFLPS